MQLYFVKSTYTNNVYKKSEFFLSGDYKVSANKMLDINFRPNDGLTQFITSNLTLADTTSIRDHTHVIVPSYDKIYKIIAIDYLNNDQWQITMDEDPFLGQYLTLEDTDIFRTRSNDPDDFRGINDVADQTFKETVATTMVSPTYKSGKWALIFMQFDADEDRYGLKFDNYSFITTYEQYASHTQITTKYPEVTTDEPEKYDYYQKIVYDYGNFRLMQCVHGINGGIGKLYWMKYNEIVLGFTDVYFKLSDSKKTRLISGDVMNIIIAMPFETTIAGDTSSLDILSFNHFVGPITSGRIIDIKVVSDLLMPIDTITYSINTSTKELRKTIAGDFLAWDFIDIFPTDVSTTPNTSFQLMVMYQVASDFELTNSFITTDPEPLEAEPFYRYDLYVYGKKYTIPYYLTDDLHMLIAINSGVINYTIYYNDKRNIVASGSFTHTMRYQIDQLDAFYAQNPTYKEQFFTKMAIDGVKTMAGGAIGGSVVPGIGTLVGAGLGLASAGIDAGIGLLNFHYMQKGLELKPEQIYGELSEISMQMRNIFGVYWVKRTPENIDQMKREYYLRGFPTLKFDSINDMSWTNNSFWGNNKLVFGELKTVIRNEFTTAFINEKLKQGVVIIQ